MAIRLENPIRVFGVMGCTMCRTYGGHHKCCVVIWHCFWIELAIYCDCWWCYQRVGWIQQQQHRGNTKKQWQWSYGIDWTLYRCYAKLHGCKTVSKRWPINRLFLSILFWSQICHSINSCGSFSRCVTDFIDMCKFTLFAFFLWNMLAISSLLVALQFLLVEYQIS